MIEVVMVEEDRLAQRIRGRGDKGVEYLKSIPKPTRPGPVRTVAALLVIRPLI